jgi:Ser/Thr protein kinase RdoA (MazF antagonist)
MTDPAAADLEEAKRKEKKPVLSQVMVADLLVKHYEKKIKTCKLLDSYDDCNYLVEDENNEKYLFKIYNGVESQSSIIEGYSKLLLKVVESITDYDFSRPVSSSGSGGNDAVYIEECPTLDGKTARCVGRLFHWVHGDTMFHIGSSASLLIGTGQAVGNVTCALVDFDHPSFHRTFAWDLRQFAAVEGFMSYIPEKNIETLCRQTLLDFHDVILPSSTSFRQSVIFGDCNDANIVVRKKEEGGEYEVSGLIDVGDATYTWTVNDLAITLAYAVLSSWGQDNPKEAILAVTAGYCSKAPLLKTEAEMLINLVRCRLATSIACGAYSISKDPDNEYLKIHAIPARTKLELLWNVTGKEGEGSSEDWTDIVVRVNEGFSWLMKHDKIALENMSHEALMVSARAFSQGIFD